MGRGRGRDEGPRGSVRRAMGDMEQRRGGGGSEKEKGGRGDSDKGQPSWISTPTQPTKHVVRLGFVLRS